MESVQTLDSGVTGEVGPGPCPSGEPGPVGEAGFEKVGDAEPVVAVIDKAPDKDSRGIENVSDDAKVGMELPPTLDVRIVSDGKRVGVFDNEGRQFGMVESIEWKCDAHSQVPKCKITLLKVPVNIVARDTKIKYKAAYRLPMSEPVVDPIPPKEEEKTDAASGPAPTS